MTALSPADRQRIAGRIRARRIERRLEQRALARQAGVALGTLQSLEWGRTVRPANIEKIAQALQTSLADLARASEHEVLTTLNAEDLEIAHAFRIAIVDVKLAVRALLTDTLPERARRAIARVTATLLTHHRNEALLRDTAAVATRLTQPPAAPATIRRGKRGA